MSGGVVCAAERLSVGYPGARRLGHARRPSMVLTDLELTVAAGELVCLLGPNGSGKSTLLRTLTGMQEPLAGRVTLHGRDLAGLSAAERARRLAVVLTDPVDVGLMTVTDLVALGRYPHLGWAGRLTPADRRVVHWALRATASDVLAHRSVDELSDGERQRVLVARALAQQPALLALDEPVAYLDLARRAELVGLLRHLARACELAVLLTTHDLDLALREADRLWVIGPDARVAVGAPEDLVLRGAVEGAFTGGTVRFDDLRGSFVTTRPVRGRARVHGRGPAAVWASRALERQGLAVVPAGPAWLEVTVATDGDRPRWRLEAPGSPTSDHRTIAGLVEAVRSLLGPRPDPPIGGPPGDPRVALDHRRGAG